MGCCCGKSNNSDTQIEVISTETNSLVCPKIGKHGHHIKVEYDTNKKYYSLQSQGGPGIALGSCHLDCDTGYWEVKIGENVTSSSSAAAGILIGVKRLQDKQQATKLLDNCFSEEATDCWYLKDVTYKKGDVIGIFWDQTALPMLSFSLNGSLLPDDTSILRIRPANDIVPAISLQDSCSCDVIFDANTFQYPPKSSKFGQIICATSII